MFVFVRCLCMRWNGVRTQTLLYRGTVQPYVVDTFRQTKKRIFLTGDSALMGHRGGTFAALDERRGAAAALELAVCRLKTLEWRIAFIRHGLREPEG